MKHVKKVFLVTLVAFSLPIWAGGDSSDGHTHDTPAPLPVNQSITPRATAVTEDFEVVVVLEDKSLVVYVDRFASNEPVAQAIVELEGVGLKGVAGERTPGTYVLNLATPLAPAKHALTISVETTDTADLLSMTLDTYLPATDVAHTHAWREWVVWGIAGALLLIAGVLIAIRRRLALHEHAKKEV